MNDTPVKGQKRKRSSSQPAKMTASTIVSGSNEKLPSDKPYRD